MHLKTSYFLAAAALVSLSAQPASAHSAYEVKHMLRDWGFTQIEVLDAGFPKYQFQGCKKGHRYHLHADYYGEITEKQQIGHCDDDAQNYNDQKYDRYQNRYER